MNYEEVAEAVGMIELEYKVDLAFEVVHGINEDVRLEKVDEDAAFQVPLGHGEEEARLSQETTVLEPFVPSERKADDANSTIHLAFDCVHPREVGMKRLVGRSLNSELCQLKMGNKYEFDAVYQAVSSKTGLLYSAL